MSNLNHKKENHYQDRFRAFGWLMQRLTGIGLLVVLGLHFWMQHMPNGFLATAEEYNAILRELGASGPEYADALASGTLKEALPGEHVITYTKVLDRLRHPLWKIIDITLLLLSLVHGMLGFGKVLGDYIQRVPLRKGAVLAGWAAAAFLALQGVVAIMTVGTN
jgi:succinate dehydrogenase / fumarate reductase membrane anchor subunit